MEDSAKRDRQRATALVLLAALLWSSGGLGVKSVDATPLALAGYRSLFAAPVLALGAIMAARRQKLSLLPMLGRPYVWGAAISYAVMVVSFVAAAKLTTAANAILLQYTCPIYVALLSWPLLRERIRGIDVLATIGVVVGMVVFFLDKVSADGRIGNFVAVLSSFGAAGVPLLLRLEQRAQTARDGTWRGAAASPYVAMALGNVLAVVACGRAMVSDPLDSGTSWVIVLALGTIQIGAAYSLYGAAVGKMSALRSTLLSTIEPILSPIWVLIGNGERPSSYAIAGGAVILLSVTTHAVVRGAKTEDFSYPRGDR
ncbi:DMT family transporter [soil metagenome]